MKLERYFDRFHLISALDCTGFMPYPVAASAQIRRGYAVGFTSGYLNEITTIQNVAFAGIAASANTAAEAASAGDVTCLVIPPYPRHRFSVPVEATDLITVAQVAAIYDLQSANSIDENDAITLGYGFRVDAIDVSTEAVAANTYGYAIGHFEYIAAS